MSVDISIPKKNIRIQLLRALAIICVVLIHTTPSGAYPSLDGLYQVFTRPFTNISVATFIFLSGYLTPINIDHPLEFYKKRIFRVLIPYIIWVILYTVASGDVGRLPKNLLTSGAAVHLYYLVVYIQLVLVSPFIKKLFYSRYRLIGWIIAPLMTIMVKYIPLIFGFELHSYISLVWGISMLGWFTYYYLGILLGNHIIEPKWKTRILVICYAVSLIIQMLEGYGLWRLGEANYGTQNKLTSFLTSSLFLLLAYKYINSETAVKNKLITKVGVLIADCSFGIYLSHIMVLWGFQYFVPGYDTIPFFLNSMLIFLVSVFFVLIGRKIFGKRVGQYLGLF